MATRQEIQFPDHTAPDFDPDQIFIAPNGQAYKWNGFGWELVQQELPEGEVTQDEFQVDQKRQDDALSAERAARIENDAALDLAIKTEAERNGREHSDIWAMIDSISTDGFVSQEQYEFDQKRQDDAIDAERATRAAGEIRFDQGIKELVGKNEREHSDLYAKIDEGNDEFLQQLAQEQYERMDADQKLLARINGLEIPEMPGDYDDSGLRELIENEGALRATGDAALNAKIELTEDKVVALNQKLEEEKAFRVEGDQALEDGIKQNNNEIGQFREDLESEAYLRQLGDQELDEKIGFSEQRLDRVQEELVSEKQFRIEGDQILDDKIGLTERRLDVVQEELVKEKQFRVEADQDLEEGIKQNNNEIGQFREDLEQEKALRAAGDADLEQGIRQNSYEIGEFREQLEAEKAFRVAGDEELEEGIKQNNNEIGEFREALEQEAALRSTGDQILDDKIGLTEQRLDVVQEELVKEKQFRVEADQEQNAVIESLLRQAEDLREAGEIEKAARLEGDIKLAQNLVEEARIRADEDYKLLARINGLEIPEMPEDYDDSGLRELIENESALRSTGDAALNIKMEQLNELESEERKRVDINLQNQIDALQDQYIYYGDNPPAEPHIGGQLWFSTAEEELTLYIYDGTNWVPASPPVSLDGIQKQVDGAHAATSEALQKVNYLQMQVDQTTEMGKWDQERQDEKIAELEAEVDDLRPTIERGSWLYNPDPESVTIPQPGEYHAYVYVSDDYCKQQLGECLLNAAGDTTAASQCNRENEDCLKKLGEADTNVSWHEVEWFCVAKADLDGRAHNFGDVVPGMYIEAVNLDGSGHGLYIIETKSTSPARCGLEVTPVHSTGRPNGKAVIKIFKMAEAANPDAYLLKSGDTMSGDLTLAADAYNSNSSNYPALKLSHPNSEGNPAVYTIRATNSGFDFNSGLIVASTISASANLQYKGSTRVGLNSSGGYLSFGTDSSKRALQWNSEGQVVKITGASGYGKEGQVLTRTSNNIEWATPAFAPKPGPFTWKWEKRTSGTASSGCMWWESSKFLYLSKTTAEGAELQVHSNFGNKRHNFPKLLLA